MSNYLKALEILCQGGSKQYKANLLKLKGHHEKLKSRRFYEKYQKKYIAAYLKRRMASNRKSLNEIKSRPCADCGTSYPPYVMDFDHLRDKQFMVSGMLTRSLKQILEEVAKCEVVCSNCHRIRTWKRRHPNG